MSTWHESTWHEFWESVSVAQAAVWIVGITVLITFVVKMWPKIRAFVNMVDALSALPKFMDDTTETLAQQDSKIADIHHEVHYNNGTSVKDALARVELGVKGIYARLDTADQDRRELREDLEQTHPTARKRAPKPKE